MTRPRPPTPPTAPSASLLHVDERRHADLGRLLLQATPQGVFLVASDTGVITFANDALARLLEHNPAEMVGRPLGDFLAEESRAGHERRLLASALDVAEQHACRLLRRDGHRIWVLIATSHVTGPAGEPETLGFVTDISAQKAAEEALLKERASMEDRVRERTRALTEANERLSLLANRDGLTGLYNHRFFQERLEQEIHRARRYGSHLSLLFMDVDHFKAYNDTHGHPRGDELLRELAGTLAPGGQGLLRACDLAARYGGEEFVVLTPDTPLDGALILAERLRRTIAVHPFRFPHPQNDGRITVSIGVAELVEASDPRGSLIERADAALYRAKADGRNRVAADGLRRTRAPGPQVN